MFVKSFAIAVLGGAASLGAALVATPALANGGDFFQELALHGLQENPDMGSPFFGFVRDPSGRGMAQATVTITAPSGESKSTTTNILGHYKLYGLDKSIDPESIEVTCSKDGFSQTRVERRPYPDQWLQPIEANCNMAPITASAD